VDELKYLTLLIQGGSFALLTGIAVWLMKWIPARFAQADVSAKEDHAARGVMVQAFREEAKYEREQCQRMFDTLAANITQHREVLSQMVTILKENQTVAHVVMQRITGEGKNP
jgi:hypothetical protein